MHRYGENSMLCTSENVRHHICFRDVGRAEGLLKYSLRSVRREGVAPEDAARRNKCKQPIRHRAVDRTRCSNQRQVTYGSM